MAEWKGWRWREWRHKGGRKGAKARQGGRKGAKARQNETARQGREDSALEGGWGWWGCWETSVQKTEKEEIRGKTRGRSREEKEGVGGWDEGGQTDWKEGEDRRTDGEDRKQGEWYVRETKDRKESKTGECQRRG